MFWFFNKLMEVTGAFFRLNGAGKDADFVHLHCSFECTATTEIPRYRIRELYSLFLSRTIFLVTPERERFAYLSPKLRAHDNFRRA